MSNLVLRGIILGAEKMGATFVKIDSTHIFFNVIKGSEIDNSEILERFRDVINDLYGLGIKIKRI